jgi:hypothetical protein
MHHDGNQKFNEVPVTLLKTFLGKAKECIYLSAKCNAFKNGMYRKGKQQNK